MSVVSKGRSGAKEGRLGRRKRDRGEHVIATASAHGRRVDTPRIVLIIKGGAATRCTRGWRQRCRIGGRCQWTPARAVDISIVAACSQATAH